MLYGTHIMFRVCKKCNEEKELELFTNVKNCLYGKSHTCKYCYNEYYRNRYNKDPSKVYEKNKKSMSKRKSQGKDVYKPIRVYRKKYPEKHNLTQRQRHAIERARIPSWSTDQDKKDIKAIYELAQKMEKVFGLKYHVDHIIPINGKNVCGFHAPNNLQILESSLNIRKSNKHVW